MIKDNYIFVHIPKTAGSSLEHRLGGFPDEKYYTTYDHNRGIPLQHLTASEIKKELGKTKFDEKYKFTIIRNPFSKCISEYFWWIRFHTNHISFKDWVVKEHSDLLNIPQKRPILQKHNIEQYKFIYDTDNNILVDFVGRFENLQEDFNIICDKIGIPQQELPHQNKSKHKHYTEYYDDETRSIVAERYAKDIEYFGYDFGG